MQGSTEEEIADELNLKQHSVNGIIESICKKISDEFHESWIDNMYWNYVPIKHNYKICSKCGESLPATDKYFSPSNQTLDGFKYYCKKCNAKNEQNRRNSTKYDTPKPV
jgi:ribosomal protein L40E